MDLCTNSVAGSGDGRPRAESADASFAVHPVTSGSVPWSTLGIVSDQELHPNQIECTQEPELYKSPKSIWCCLQDRVVWIHRRPVSSGCLA